MLILMNRKGLTRTVARKSDYTFAQCDEIIRLAFQVITGELNGHGHVMIPNFGTFYVEEKDTTIYHNPVTGKETIIAARKYPKFRSAPALKDAVK